MAFLLHGINNIDRMLNDKNVQLTLLDIPKDYINEDFINLDTKKAKHEISFYKEILTD